MKEGSKYLSILLSTVTLFGPISYLLYAFYESGRLTHFGAPVEFIQLTSFGILPVIETIHPGIILTAIVFTILGGMKHTTPLDQFRMGSGAVGYVAATIAVIASNEVMKWVFGLTAFSCGLIVFFVTTTSPDLGNEEEKTPPIPSSGAEKYTSSIRRGIFIIAAAVFFCIGYVTAGVKQSKTQIDYWMSGDRVALAIYGNIVLLADLNGKIVGPNFEILETKSLPKPLVIKKVGPLKPLAEKVQSTTVEPSK